MTNMTNMVDEKTYQVFISSITWKKDTTGNYRVKFNKPDELPTQFTLDIPMNVVVQAEKKRDEFNDVIETFVYNFLTHKFGHEVYHCQIFLPLD